MSSPTMPKSTVATSPKMLSSIPVSNLNLPALEIPKPAANQNDHSGEAAEEGFHGHARRS
jgi:hypothetical protein